MSSRKVSSQEFCRGKSMDEMEWYRRLRQIGPVPRRLAVDGHDLPGLYRECLDEAPATGASPAQWRREGQPLGGIDVAAYCPFRWRRVHPSRSAFFLSAELWRLPTMIGSHVGAGSSPESQKPDQTRSNGSLASICVHERRCLRVCSLYQDGILDDRCGREILHRQLGICHLPSSCCCGSGASTRVGLAGLRHCSNCTC